MADIREMESNFITKLRNKHNTPVKDAASLKFKKETMDGIFKSLGNIPEKMHSIGEPGKTSAKQDVGGQNGLNSGPAKEY